MTAVEVSGVSNASCNI